LNGHLEAAREQQPCQRRRDDALAQRRHHTARNEDVSSIHSPIV
jgi:hypothetical protein